MRVGELEIAQHQRQRQLGLGQRELAADAGALAVAKRHVGVARQPGFVIGQEAVDVEALGIGPDPGVAVQRGQHDGNAAVLADQVAAAEQRVRVRRNREGGRGRPQAQRFLEHAVEHRQPCQVGVHRRGVAGQHRIHLGIRLRHHAGIAQQLVQGEGQQPAGGFVAGDQEGDDLVADVLVVQALVRVGIARFEHQPEQVHGSALPPAFVGGAAAPDHVVDQFAHEARVFIELAVRRVHEAVLQAKARELGHRLSQRADHGLDERVQLRTGKRVEVIAEAGQRDGVERQPRHVVGHGDIGVRALPVPFVDQPAGHAQHRVEIPLHRALAEGRHQDAVRLAPVGLVGVRGEQAVAGHAAQVGQWRADVLAEACRVAHFGSQRDRGHERHAPAGEVQFEDALMMAAARQQVLAHRARLDLQQVADHGPAGIARDRLGRCQGGAMR
ncbi:hypothetical protein D9M68_410080 [compost metagenome]